MQTGFCLRPRIIPLSGHSLAAPGENKRIYDSDHKTLAIRLMALLRGDSPNLFAATPNNMFKLDTKCFPDLPLSGSRRSSASRCDQCSPLRPLLVP